MLWTRESLSDLFLFSLAGIFVLSWWIVPLGVFFGVYFCPRLSQWPRKASCDQRHPAWAVLGLLTAVFFTVYLGIARRDLPFNYRLLSYPSIVLCGAADILG